VTAVAPAAGVASGFEAGRDSESAFRSLLDVPRRIYNNNILRIIVIRLLQSIPVIVGVTFIVFLLLNLLPGGTVGALLGQNSTPALVHALTVKLGLNHPLMQRYFHWLWQAVRGNFGNSLVNGVPVAGTIGTRLPVSAEVGLFAFVAALVAAIPVALLAARKPHGLFDRFMFVLNMLAVSCPVFVVALLGVIVFAVHLHWVPAFGFVPLSRGLGPNLRSIVLPSMSIALGIFSQYTRIVRADLIDQMNGEDYIVTARAKGLSSPRILFIHAFRNAVFNLITVVVINLGFIITGSVILESIFGIPGIGLLLIDALQLRDVVTIQAVVALIAVIVVVSNLAADILYSILDPRIRHGSSIN
jgi:peptide/nickel transport system permease protein